MEKIQFRCELLSDIVLNDSSATEGKRRSLDFIPGNNFLGIVASQLYKETDEAAWLIFHSGHVRFGDAHPSANGTRGLRIPASLFYPKLKGIEGGCYIRYLVEEDAARKMQLRQCREGFCTFGPEQIATQITVDKDFAIKSAYDSDTRRPMDNQIFGYEALCSGLVLLFSIEIDEEAKAYKDAIVKAICGLHHVGRSRSAQYGCVEIAECGFEEAAPLPTPLYIGSRQYVAVYADSRLVFFDGYGNSTFRPQPADLGIEHGEIDWGRSQIRTFQYAPWNYQRQAFDADRCGIEKGSVFLVETDCMPPATGTVGCYQTEGFGQIVYNPVFLQGDKEGHSIFQFVKQEKPACEKRGKGVDSSLVRFLQKREEDAKKQNIIITEVNKFVEANKELFKQDVFASQWGSIRSLAMVYEDEEKLKDIIGSRKQDGEGKRKGYINHGTAAEKWDQRGRKERLWEFLENEELKGHLQEAVINLASEMAKICKP